MSSFGRYRIPPIDGMTVVSGPTIEGGFPAILEGAEKPAPRPVRFMSIVSEPLPEVAAALQINDEAFRVRLRNRAAQIEAFAGEYFHLRHSHNIGFYPETTTANGLTRQLLIMNPIERPRGAELIPEDAIGLFPSVWIEW
jgi:hypothetical protein